MTRQSIALFWVLMMAVCSGLRLQTPALPELRRLVLAGAVAASFGCFSQVHVTHAAEAQLFGLKEGRLLPCPSRSNCISTSSVKSVEKYSRPWTFKVSPEEMFAQVLSATKSIEFLTIDEQDKEKFYIHLTAKSAVPPTSLDDIEFLINPSEKFITFRSNSREVVMAGTQQLGDGGSNKNRLQQIQRKLGVKEIGVEEYDSGYFEFNGSGLPFDGLLPSTNFFKYQSRANDPAEINFLDTKTGVAEN
jgi:uncharacterized protein (DUF1499 family)